MLAVLDSAVLRWPLTLGYLAALLIAAIYGLHRYWLVRTCYRSRHNQPHLQRRFTSLPTVTVQLPIYNEAAVVERVVEAACALDYPRNCLQIQVLDDSTDACAAMARRCVDRFQARGHNIEYLHRLDRQGFKAGALQAGLTAARGELIAVFDADFVPPTDFLRRTVHHFTDPGVGMVQACWDHLNRDDSLLTQAQAIFLDGHFHIEHAARNRSGRWMNFNGTAGVWRRGAIEEAGGWRHDTLTEDVDLSYRAQLAGWRFLFLQDLRCPAELPPTMGAFKSQQHRWTKGGVQCALKLLPRIVRASAPWRCKLEAWFHLTSPMVHLCVVVIALLMGPVVWMNLVPFERGTWSGAAFGFVVLLLATASGAVFYLAGQREAGRRVWQTLWRMPVLIGLGAGMSLSNSCAVLEALVGYRSPFVRTPKYNRAGKADGRSGRLRLQASGPVGTAWLELAMGVYLTGCIALTLRPGWSLGAVPFLVIFAAGFLSVGLASLWPRHMLSPGRTDWNALPAPAVRETDYV